MRYLRPKYFTKGGNDTHYPGCSLSFKMHVESVPGRGPVVLLCHYSFLDGGLPVSNVIVAGTESYHAIIFISCFVLPVGAVGSLSLPRLLLLWLLPLT